MSRILQAFYQETYADLENDLVVNWAVGAKGLAVLASVLKGIQRKQLSLACAATVTGLKSARNEYAEGIVQTSYLSVVLALRGMENSACVLVRQTIELSLKHIYFATHPVEYGWTVDRENYRELSFQALIDYVKKTSEYQDLFAETGCDLCGPIEDDFALLSRYVHVHSRRFITYRQIVTPPKIDGNTLQRLDRVTALLWPVLTALLVVYFPVRFARAQELEKKLIRATLPPKIKASLARYLRNRQSGRSRSSGGQALR